MGQKDLTEKNLELYPDVFADIVNVLLYQGKEVVSEDDLQPAPTETLYPDREERLRNQFHDVSKYVMRDGNINTQYTLENETGAKRKTVLRKAGYEGAVYRMQFDGKESYPVISCILHWGKKPWRQPRSLFQLWEKVEVTDAMKEYIDDIKLHVYDMCCLPPEIRKRFKSDMRIIVDYLAEGKEYIPTTQKIVHLEALLRMLGVLTGDGRYEELIAGMQSEEKREGGVTMCELLDKYEAKGLEKGIEKGIEKGVVESIRNLMDTMKWTAEQAMAALKIKECDKNRYLAKLQN